jgi:uncharacterized protein with GYD domain
MPQYIILSNWTDQGAKNAKETVTRARAAAAAFEKAGGKLLHTFWTLGQYDLVLIAQAPSDEVLTALNVQLAALGNIRSSTLRAFDATEMEQILKKV